MALYTYNKTTICQQLFSALQLTVMQPSCWKAVHYVFYSKEFLNTEGTNTMILDTSWAIIIQPGPKRSAAQRQEEEEIWGEFSD